MLDQLKKIFCGFAPDATEQKTHSLEENLQIACAALLIELTRADFQVHPEEEAEVSAALRAAFALPDSTLQPLITLAEESVNHAVSLHDYTKLIHEHYTSEQKKELLRLMWSVAYADDALDKHEEHFIRKVAELLYLPHTDFVHTKHLVKMQRENAQD